MMHKETYEAPTLRAHGSLEARTQGGSVGTVLDQGFPAGTPFNEVTLS